MNIITIIPARGGSKAIPKKNLTPFAGKPLLHWSILQALQSKYVSQVYVSSDAQDILDAARSWNAIPILRPSEIATDSASSESALLHALDYVESTAGPVDLVVFLQATSPLRFPNDIDHAIDAFLAQDADSLFSMSVLDNCTIWKESNGVLSGATYDPENRLPRQASAKHLLENGSIYVFKPHILRTFNNRLGGKVITYPMQKWQSVDIDAPDDIPIAELFFNAYLKPHYAKGSTDVSLIVYDFDGVMTDNTVSLSQDGVESISVNRSDGLAIAQIKSLGIPQLIISSDANPVVQKRAQKLGIPAIHNCQDKRKALYDFCEQNKISLSQTAFVGNDINDIPALQAVGYPITPSDAYPQAKSLATLVTKAKGGQGVIREIYQTLFSKN